MNTFQLISALKSQSITRKYFNGVYAYDTLMLVKNKPNLIICNTQPSYKEGEHWVLLFFNNYNNTADFFDPLGNNIHYYGNNFVKFVKKFAKYYNSNNLRVQPVKSSLCGIYCLYYAYLRCKGYNMKFILKTIPNSSFVSKCVKKKFPICFNSKCFDRCTMKNYK
jgi:hypothetical protein